MQPWTIERDGFPAETHVVTTEDGYLLEVHRIPRGREDFDDTEGYRPAIYMQHGHDSSSSNFILAGPDKSLGACMYILKFCNHFYKERSVFQLISLLMLVMTCGWPI